MSELLKSSFECEGRIMGSVRSLWLLEGCERESAGLRSSEEGRASHFEW